MKRNDFIILISVAAYSILFYEQQRGINFLLFSVLMVALLLIRNFQLIKQPSWLAAASGTLISGACVFIFGNELSFIANAISLSLLSAFSLNASASLIVALFNAMFSYVTGVVMIFVDWLERKKESVKSSHPLSVKFLLVIIPLVVTLIFFSLYQSSNPLFENFTQNINLDFISWNWVRFTLVGFIVMYAYFYHRFVPALTQYDLTRGNKLIAAQVKYKPVFGSSFLPQHEQLSGTILFFVLNALLLIVNVLDVKFLWMGNALPQGMTWSESVHQGIGALIASIVFAEIIILFYFRGVLNFSEGNALIKLLAYIWILQNILMILSTAYRNLNYVDAYSLTYKRIGVFVYLLLCMGGLMITFIKIAGVKTNWYLFRKNGWIFYTVLVIAACINWDVWLTNYNIGIGTKNQKQIDKQYLLGLAPHNIPQLIRMDKSLKHKDMSDDNSGFGISSDRSTSSFINQSEIADETFNNLLSKSIYEFVKSEQDQSWQSYCYERHQIYSGINKLNEEGRIELMDLSDGNFNTLKPVSHLNKIEQIEFDNNQKFDLSELAAFPALKQLNITNCKIDTLDYLPAMPKLINLNLSFNNLIHLNNLSKLQQLKHLDISNAHIFTLDELPVLNNLESLDVASNSICDFSLLSRFIAVKDLDVSSNSSRKSLVLPVMHSLQTLNLSNCQLQARNHNLKMVLPQLMQLQYINLSSNSISDWSLILSEESVAVMPQLKAMDISNNSFRNFDLLQRLSSVEELDASTNIISSAKGIESLRQLKSLHLGQCKSLINISSLATCSQLKNLYLNDDVSVREIGRAHV